MASEYPQVSIGDLVDRGHARLQTGPFGSQLHKHDYTVEGIPVIPTEGIGRGRIVADAALPLISETKAGELSRHRLMLGDILFARRGIQATGLSAIVDQGHVGSICGTGALLLRVDPAAVDPKFLAAYLSTAEAFDWLRSNAVGAVMPNLNTSIISRLRVPMPPMGVQAAVGQFIACLDDRIDLLRQINATLEAIAQALFKSWFVDFDPVRAKAEGREPEGMDPATAAIFPSEFEESELGLIPKGWQIDEIGKVGACVGGATPSTKEPRFWDDPVHHWVTPKDLSGLQSPVLIDTERKVSEAGLAKISSGLLPIGTLLLSSRAPIGYLAIAHVPTAINQGFIAMLPGGQLPASYLLFWTKLNMDAIKQKANGSTFMEISKSAFRPIRLVVPPPQVITEFDSICKPMLDRIAENEKKRRHLGGIRDTLLPRLISGKLRLPQDEAVEETSA